MPAVIAAHIEIREALRDSAERAIALNERLERLIAVRSSQPSGGFHGKIDFSQPPWNASVANAVMDLHAQARKTERVLRHELGLPRRARGNSSANTVLALRSVVRLCEKAEDHVVRLTTRELEKWSRRALMALGEAEVPKRLPRHPGQPEPLCPLCNGSTLRMLALKGTIRCISPSCKDENGKRLTARMEYSTLAADWVLVWSDQEAA
jgi:hypothetical protein